MDDLKELKYHSEYGLILLMGISKTSDFGRFFQMKETKDVSFTCTLIYKGKLFKVNQSEKDEFHFRWLDVNGFSAAFPISITLFFNHLNWN